MILGIDIQHIGAQTNCELRRIHRNKQTTSTRSDGNENNTTALDVQRVYRYSSTRICRTNLGGSSRPNSNRVSLSCQWTDDNTHEELILINSQ